MLETGNLGVDIIVDQGISQYPQVLLFISWEQLWLWHWPLKVKPDF
jgi:hypothetical protein